MCPPIVQRFKEETQNREWRSFAYPTNGRGACIVGTLVLQKGIARPARREGKQVPGGGVGQRELTPEISGVVVRGRYGLLGRSPLRALCATGGEYTSRSAMPMLEAKKERL